MEILKKCPPYQDKYIIQKILKETEYNIHTYDDIFVDETSKIIKIKKGDYLEIGKYSIVDQGQEHIGGYTNEERGIYTNTPFIIFGDHTRTVKYIDFPSFIGADGVKVLNIKEDMSEYLDIKYIYYYLTYTDIPNDGYSRHFKYIKKLLYVVPPIEIQKKIVEVLDEAQKLIDNRKKQIELLDDLIESIFYDMFGDPVKNDKGWEVKKLGDNLDFIKYGVSSPPEFSVNGKCFIRATNIDNGRISSTDMKYIGLDEQSRLDNYKLDLGDVLMVRSGVNAGDSAYIDSNYAGGYGGYDLIIRLNKTKLNYIFLNQIFQSNFKEKIIKPLTRRAAQPHINATQVKKLDIIISPLSLQNEFAKKVQAIEKQKELLEKSLKLMEDNYNSLMQRAFKGELF